MTVPDTGARAFTLTPGQPATLLTSNAGGPDNPATVISDDVAGCRVYLSADGGVGAATGVPLDPGTSQPWTSEGQLWAYADPAGTAPASIRLTSAISDWQPSPAAIAAQVAAQLLAQGIPIAATTKTLYSGNIVSGGTSGAQDCSLFSTAALTIRYPSGSGSDRFVVKVTWLSAVSLGTVLGIDTVTFHDAQAYAGAFAVLQWLLPIRGQAVKIDVIGDNGNNVNVTLQGTTRAIPKQVLSSFPAGTGSGIGAQTGRNLLNASFGSLGAGATGPTVYVPPVAEKVTIYLNQAIAAVSVNANGVFELAGGLVAANVMRSGGAGIFNQGQPLYIPNTGLELAATNSDTISHTTLVNVWDAS